MTCTSTAVDALEARLRHARIVPVIRVGDPDAARDLVERLLEAGLDTVELTTTIRGWQEVVTALREHADELTIGVGTILSTDRARQAADAGADFCVSPCLMPSARAVLQAAGVPFIEGGLTPTELLDATSRGIAKLFPAHVGGVQYLRSLLAVAPEARIMPTGGLALSDVGDWLAAGALAVGVGSDLTAPGAIAPRIEKALAT
jgi:2-dehydro-3-deoxyphosphogluconate aldolase/(4S)-4-hydroxy-2-oxoglutarate aldolase